MAKGKVLVVDDEIYIVLILDFSLGMEGYEVLTALATELAEKDDDDESSTVVLADVRKKAEAAPDDDSADDIFEARQDAFLAEDVDIAADLAR